MKIKIGSKVTVTGDSSFCSTSREVITNILTKYDEDTGKPYKVYCINDHLFSGKTGWAMTPPYMYYIQELNA